MNIIAHLKTNKYLLCDKKYPQDRASNLQHTTNTVRLRVAPCIVIQWSTGNIIRRLCSNRDPVVERGGKEVLLRYTKVHFGTQKVLFGKRGELVIKKK
jgi:hypothetical protein